MDVTQNKMTRKREEKNYEHILRMNSHVYLVPHGTSLTLIKTLPIWRCTTSMPAKRPNRLVT